MINNAYPTPVQGGVANGPPGNSCQQANNSFNTTANYGYGTVENLNGIAKTTNVGVGFANPTTPPALPHQQKQDDSELISIKARAQNMYLCTGLGLFGAGLFLLMIITNAIWRFYFRVKLLPNRIIYDTQRVHIYFHVETADELLLCIGLFGGVVCVIGFMLASEFSEKMSNEMIAYFSTVQQSATAASIESKSADLEQKTAVREYTFWADLERKTAVREYTFWIRIAAMSGIGCACAFAFVIMNQRLARLLVSISPDLDPRKMTYHHCDWVVVMGGARYLSPAGFWATLGIALGIVNLTMIVLSSVCMMTHGGFLGGGIVKEARQRADAMMFGGRNCYTVGGGSSVNRGAAKCVRSMGEHTLRGLREFGQ